MDTEMGNSGRKVIGVQAHGNKKDSSRENVKEPQLQEVPYS